MDLDNKEEDIILQALVAHQNTTLNVMCDTWLLQEQQNQQVVAVLALCNTWGLRHRLTFWHLKLD